MTTTIDANQIRRKYLDFFKKQQHAVIERAPLVLYDDPTTLFTSSGMQPLLPYLLGKPHPDGSRLTDSQTCLRTQDIEDVGDNRHTTYFEMLGNWSLGDYFKKEQIRWFFTFLTEEVGLDPEKIYVTAFIGDKENDIPRDDETAHIWQEIFAEKGIDAQIVEIGSAENGDKRGIKPGERIFFYDDKENWWSRGAGLQGTPIGDPCGPDSEVFYDFGPEHHDPSYGKAHPASDSGQFMEIGNQVFMQYKRNDDGTFSLLEKKNVDFGGGLERITAAAMGNPDVFQINLLQPIVHRLEEISGKKYLDNTESMRVIADHLRAATMLVYDGVIPSNKEQGYVLRRLVRRAVRYALALGIEEDFLGEIVPQITQMYENDFPGLSEKANQIIAILEKEERAFRRTLRKGLVELNKMSNSQLTGEDIFKLYDTYGFPVELSVEEIRRQGLEISADWEEEYSSKRQEQRERSQTAAKGAFQGGLRGDSLDHRRHHTATHLLNAALLQVLGAEVAQRGSNVKADSFRFDFNHDGKVPAEKLKQVEDLVNEWIKQDLPVSYKTYPTDEALKLGAVGAFGDKYGSEVKVYQVGSDEHRVSFEICGGPHVEHTGQLGKDGKSFKIVKEKASSAGVRRIKAALL